MNQETFEKIAQDAFEYGYVYEMDALGMDKEAAIFNPAAFKATVKTMGKAWGRVGKHPIQTIKALSGKGNLVGRTGKALSGNAYNVTREAYQGATKNLLGGSGNWAKTFGKGTSHPIMNSLKKIVRTPIQAGRAISGRGGELLSKGGKPLYGGAYQARQQGFQRAFGNLSKPIKDMKRIVSNPIQAMNSAKGSGTLLSKGGKPLYGTAYQNRGQGFTDAMGRLKSLIIA